MKRLRRTVPLGMILACAATWLLLFAAPAGDTGSGRPERAMRWDERAARMSQAELAAAVGGKPAYCDKALVSCVEGCGTWGWLGQVFVGSCNSGCYYGYTQCGGA